MEKYVIGYRKIDEREYKKIKKNKFIINQPDYYSLNIYKTKNNINYIFFFENCNLALKLIESEKKSYIMRCKIPVSLIERGKGYYYSYLIPEFKMYRKYFNKEYIESIVEEDKIPNDWLDDLKYNEIMIKSQIIFDSFPFIEEKEWKKKLNIENLNMYLPYETVYDRKYGRKPDEYLIRGIYNYGLENIKKIINLNQSNQIKIDILRAISDLVVGLDKTTKLLKEYYIYDNEGYEFANMLLENECNNEKIQELKRLKVLGKSNNEIKRII